MLSLLSTTWQTFRERDGNMLSAAVAFYVTLAAAPLGVIALAMTEWVFDARAARGEMLRQAEAFIGPDLAKFVIRSVDQARPAAETTITSAVSVFIILFVSLRLFAILRRALNHIWGVRAHLRVGLEGKRRRLLKRRLGAALFTGIFAAALLVLMVARVLMNRAQYWMGVSGSLWFLAIEQLAGSATVFFLLAALIALVFRYLPDAQVAWMDVAVGAATTSVFLTLGSFLIGSYLAHAGLQSAYGAAGSFVVLLVWIYYSTQILFLGAAFTYCWAKRSSRPIQPLPYASRLLAVSHSTNIWASET